MSQENKEEKLLLPHHEQQSLCTTRLPYRQGRKLTAVKVYTITNESNHLLIFGVPSLDLRKEVKSLFSKFGRLLQFSVTTKYPAEQFTENYHAIFEKIQSARMAKKMLDTNNFYGGSLHISYAPELEQLNETRNKILQRQRDVLNRLRNLEKESVKSTKKVETAQPTVSSKDILLEQSKKLNMGEVNIIGAGKQIRDVVFNKNKRRNQEESNVVIEKKFKPCFVTNSDTKSTVQETTNFERNIANSAEIPGKSSNLDKLEIIDFTSVEKKTISNIDEALNYNKFGNEVIKKVPPKPVNRIKFNIWNKK